MSITGTSAGLLTTMLDRAYRLSSSWSFFTKECERLKSVFSKLKYPKHLVDSTVKTFLNLKVADQPSSPSRCTTENTTWVVILFKDQESANIVKTQLKDLNVKLQTIVQPVCTSRKIAQEFPTNEPKPQLIDQQCVAYNFKCDQCAAGYVGYTHGHLFVRVSYSWNRIFNLVTLDLRQDFSETSDFSIVRSTIVSRNFEPEEVL